MEWWEITRMIITHGFWFFVGIITCIYSIKKPNKLPMKKLSKCKWPESYAYCESCEEGFKNDLNVYGNIKCPNGCNCVLQKGLTLDKLMDIFNSRKNNEF